jgi:hypothetical protein
LKFITIFVTAGIQWMLKYLDDIMNYKPDEEATAPTNERLARFYAFLEKQDYQKFFVWVDFENPELCSDYYKAPLFYEAGKLPMPVNLNF